MSKAAKHGRKKRKKNKREARKVKESMDAELSASVNVQPLLAS